MHQFTVTIPNDLITNIAARVGSSSLADLCNLKQSCKALYELGKDNLVFKQASMEKLPPVPWMLSDEAAFFLERCQQTGNPEALFRLGMVEYFKNVRLELGRAFLARAACLGHLAASYVLGMILICTDMQLRKQGLELLNGVEATRHDGFLECRKKTKSIVNQMWRNHFIHLEEPLCTDPNCKKNCRIPSAGWVSRDTTCDEGFDNEEFSCFACKCDHEVQLFSRMISS